MSFIDSPIIIRVEMLNLFHAPVVICINSVCRGNIYSNKEVTSVFYGSISFDPIMLSPQK